MARKLGLPPRLSVGEVERRDRGARDPVARSHWRIAWLLARGAPTAEAARATGYSVNRVREVARRYRGGPAALGDRRHANPGAAPLLTAEQREELRAALAGPAPDGGLWTCRQVAGWIGERAGRAVAEARGWEYLRRLGFSPQRPRPRETRADPAAQAACKRGASGPRSTPARPPTRAPR